MLSHVKASPEAEAAVVAAICCCTTCRYKVTSTGDNGQQAASAACAPNQALACYPVVAAWRRCILDQEPRTFDPANRSLLRNFAEMIGREVERQFMLHELESTKDKHKQQHEQVISDVESSREASMLVDFSSRKWPVLAANSGWCQVTGGQQKMT